MSWNNKEVYTSLQGVTPQKFVIFIVSAAGESDLTCNTYHSSHIP